jgi:hypothetical protein
VVLDISEYFVNESREYSKNQLKVFYNEIDMILEKKRVNHNKISSNEKHKDKYYFKTNSKMNFGIPFENKNKLSGIIEIRTSYFNKDIDLNSINLEYKFDKTVVEAGKLFLSLSDLVFNTPQEGILVKVEKPAKNMDIKMFLSRNDEGTDYQEFSKYNFGFNLNKKFKKGNFGVNVIISKDEDDSIKYNKNNMSPKDNMIIEALGNYNFSNLILNYEVAYSIDKFESNELENNQQNNGNAFKLNSIYNLKDYYFNLGLERITSDFVAENGINDTDYQKVNFQYRSKYKKLDYSFDFVYKEDNVDDLSDTTNTLFQYVLKSSCDIPNKYTDSLKYFNGLEIRKNLNDHNKIVAHTNDLINYDLYMGIQGKFFENFLSSVKLGYEKERDELTEDHLIIRKYEFSANYKKDIKKFMFGVNSYFKFDRYNKKMARFYTIMI